MASVVVEVACIVASVGIVDVEVVDVVAFAFACVGVDVGVEVVEEEQGWA